MQVESEISGADEESDVAKLNRISSQMEFPDGDPRRGPFSEREVEHAQHYLQATDRWRPRAQTDLFAVRLQYGRGLTRYRITQMFAISDSIVQDRKNWAGRRKWIPNMSERDRRTLARLVWLGGLLRQHFAGQDADEAVLDGLKAASEWKRVEDEEKVVWLPQDENGETWPMKIHKEISDDDHCADQSGGRDDHAAMWAKLEDELEALDAIADVENDGEERQQGEVDALSDGAEDAAQKDTETEEPVLAE